MIKIGDNKFDKEEIYWDIRDIINGPINGHMLIVGGSGTGKTYRLLKIINQAKSIEGIKIYTFDVHGDMSTNEADTSSVTFSESSRFGLNPLLINQDPDYGGIRRRVNSFISMINRYSTTKLGNRQETVIRNLFYDLYASNGFYLDAPLSWGMSDNKRMPTLLDLKRFAYAKLRNYFVGSERVAQALIELSNKKTALTKKTLKDSDNDEIEKLKEKCYIAFQVVVEREIGAKEIDDLIKYSSKEILKSVYDRIDNLYAYGIFKDVPPNFAKKPIWRFDLKSLTHEEQGFILELSLERIFTAAKKRGVSRNIHTIIVIDELQKFISDDPGHIINVMMREIRKFGVGMVFATQKDFSRIPEDIVTNCATKLILGVDEMFHDMLSKKLGIELKKLRYIQPQKTAIIQSKTKQTQSHNRYVDVMLAP